MNMPVTTMEQTAAADTMAAFAGYVIKDAHAERWRTMDSLGMPDWTDDINQALCTRLRVHAERYSEDDEAEVVILPVALGEDADAVYRRGLRDGGTVVFDTVMRHESNAGRGMDIYLALKGAADDALAVGIIVQDPDEQPLWEHLINEAFHDFDARTSGMAPFTFPADLRHAFKKAVRSMLAKKLPAPDSENLRLREALARIHHARTGERIRPTAPLNQLLAIAGTPAAEWRVAGEPDPHGSRYDCERAALCMGELTDDVLANEMFLRGDKRPTAHELVQGVLPPIAYLTAGKDRIRWLSRSLVRTQFALRMLYEETADYIRLNNLGDVHHNRSMRLARDALAGTPGMGGTDAA